MISAVTFDDISSAYLSRSKLKELIEFVRNMHVACTFFVVPDDSTCQVSQEYRRLLQTAVENGHELSLHGCTHARNEFGLFYTPPGAICSPIPIPSYAKQHRLLEIGRKRLLRLVGVEATGFRAPNYLFNTNTLKALANLGFRYDSSATAFKTTHCSRFRVRWLAIRRPVMANGILEIPVTGDYTYSLGTRGFADSLKTAMRDFELTRCRDAVFVMNNHPARFGDTHFKFLKTLMKSIEKDTRFFTLDRIAKSVSSIGQQRAGQKIQCVQTARGLSEARNTEIIPMTRTRT